ncbi:hypothetical protein BH11ACT1_BH11ACT1_18180 [soil metagenome]
MTEDGNPILELLRQADARTAAAEAFYAMLERQGQLASHRVLTYRCARRCLLAEVLRTTSGLVIHHDRYKMSPTRNETSSSASGRRVNTEDGDRRWKARTYFITEAANLTVSCDHIANRTIEIRDVLAALESGTSEVVVRRSA